MHQGIIIFEIVSNETIRGQRPFVILIEEQGIGQESCLTFNGIVSILYRYDVTTTVVRHGGQGDGRVVVRVVVVLIHRRPGWFFGFGGSGSPKGFD